MWAYLSLKKLINVERTRDAGQAIMSSADGSSETVMTDERLRIGMRRFLETCRRGGGTTADYIKDRKAANLYVARDRDSYRSASLLVLWSYNKGKEIAFAN